MSNELTCYDKCRDADKATRTRCQILLDQWKEHQKEKGCNMTCKNNTSSGKTCRKPKKRTYCKKRCSCKCKRKKKAKTTKKCSKNITIEVKGK